MGFLAAWQKTREGTQASFPPSALIVGRGTPSLNGLCPERWDRLWPSLCHHLLQRWISLPYDLLHLIGFEQPWPHFQLCLALSPKTSALEKPGCVCVCVYWEGKFQKRAVGSYFVLPSFLSPPPSVGCMKLPFLCYAKSLGGQPWGPVEKDSREKLWGLEFGAWLGPRVPQPLLRLKPYICASKGFPILPYPNWAGLFLWITGT